MAELPPEPGVITDMDHGIPGPEEPLPEGDAEEEVEFE